ncbi:MAG TPA: hypothetical protein VMB24_04295 [Dehalococcoidales bacterium]|nr:hypothetical protein [Dehalococcoidales bacterium]
MKKALQIFGAIVKAFQRYHLLLVLAGLLIISVIFYGLHDRGMIIAYVATAIIMAEIVYRWRKITYFLWLAVGAFVSSIFLSFLHEVVVIPLVRLLLGGGGLNSFGVRIFHDFVSLWVLFPGIMGIITGLLGMLILAIFKGVGLISGNRSRNLT